MKPVRLVDFQNGGISIACPDSIDARGDVNLNGIAMEIADAKLLAQAILRGPDVLPRIGREGSIAASDFTADGLTLTVADLVYMHRAILGDAVQRQGLLPFMDSVIIDFSRNVLSTESPVPIGGLIAVFDCDSNCRIKAEPNLPIATYYDTTTRELRVLVPSAEKAPDSTYMRSCLGWRLPEGKNRLFTVRGRAKLKGAHATDYNSNLLRSNLTNEMLPGEFVVANTVPSWPNRGEAKIEFYLAKESDWRIEVFNRCHQLVQIYQGLDVGHKTINCDAANWCPSYYTYTFVAGDFATTRTLIEW